MLDEITFLKGRVLLTSLSSLRYFSALIASSPRTAYSTFKNAGLTVSMVRGGILCKERKQGRLIDGRNRNVGPIMNLHLYLNIFEIASHT
jgi:hypothetical protein